MTRGTDVGCPGGDDHLHVPGEQLGEEGGKPLVLRPSILDQNVLPFDVT